jgi:hypothetical protein
MTGLDKSCTRSVSELVRSVSRRIQAGYVPFPMALQVSIPLRIDDATWQTVRHTVALRAVMAGIDIRTILEPAFCRTQTIRLTRGLVFGKTIGRVTGQ